MRDLLQGPATVEAIRGRHGLSCQKGSGHGLLVRLPTINVCERLTLIGAVPGSCSIKASGQLRQAPVILRRLQPGLLPFVVHEAKCAQPKQRDPAARKRANEACIAAP